MVSIDRDGGQNDSIEVAYENGILRRVDCRLTCLLRHHLIAYLATQAT
jgi:hypothetical protein